MSSASSHGSAFDANHLLAQREWLAHFARALVANPVDVDDVVQQTWANALARPPAHATNLRGWLGTIARNVVRSGSRSDRARAAREERVPPPPPVTDPHEAVERTELRRRVVEAVLALAEPYRTTVILRFLEEQEVALVARTMQTNEETVRTRIRRGVERVREALHRGAEAGAAGPEEQTAARALLLAGLREISTSAGAPAIGGGGGASRGLVRSGRRLTTRVMSRRLVLAALTVAAAGGGLVWWKVAHPSAPEATTVASRTVTPPAPEIPAPTHPAPDVAPERVPAATSSAPPSSDAKTAPPEKTVPAAPTEEQESGTVHGLVTDPAGNPLGNAYVWAIAQPNADAAMSTPLFGTKAKEAADRFDDKQSTPNWFPVITEDDGTYVIKTLSERVRWLIGAFDPDLGGVAGPVVSFDHEHGAVTVDLKLVHGQMVTGAVKDESGAPLGNARLTLWSRCGDSLVRTDLVTTPSGPDVGAFDAGFRCAEKLEIEAEAPGFSPFARHAVEFAPGATGARLSLKLHRRPGLVVHGRVVDPAGKPVAILDLLDQFLTTTAPIARSLEIAVRAVPETVPGAGAATGGRFDFDRNEYDVVVPDGFRGALELTISGRVVGSAPLVDLAHAPDLPCDVTAIPADVAPTVFAVRFVDAETKQPIDFSQPLCRPRALDASNGDARLRAEGSDRVNGVVNFGCLPGDLTVEAVVDGYAAGLFHVVVPPGGSREPRTLELEKGKNGTHGRVLHADGRPFANTLVRAYQVTANGVIDASGIEILTSGQGEFEFPFLAPGEHVIVASGSPEEANGIAHIVVADSSPAVEIRCCAGSPVRFRISAVRTSEAAPQTRLRIVDAAGAIVEESDHAWEPKKRSFDEYSALLRDGHYTVVIGRVGFKEKTVEVDAPTREAVDVALEPLPRRPR